MITFTREEAEQVLNDLEGEIPFYSENDCNTPEWITNAIELLRARLSEPEPEPVAWFIEGTFMDGTPSFIQVCETDPEFYTPLYTSPPQREPEPEPVAVVDANDEGYWADILPDRNVKVGQLLYTSPPQRDEASAKAAEWVGLTDEERTFIAWESNNGTHCVAMTEAKLKEKNGG